MTQAYELLVRENTLLRERVESAEQRLQEAEQASNALAEQLKGVLRMKIEAEERAEKLEADLAQTEKGERAADQEVERLQQRLQEAERRAEELNAELRGMNQRLSEMLALAQPSESGGGERCPEGFEPTPEREGYCQHCGKDWDHPNHLAHSESGGERCKERGDYTVEEVDAMYPACPHCRRALLPVDGVPYCEHCDFSADTPRATTGERMPYLKNRADGVDGHYVIARDRDGYSEFWTERGWSSAGTVFRLHDTAHAPADRPEPTGEALAALDRLACTVDGLRSGRKDVEIVRQHLQAGVPEAVRRLPETMEHHASKIRAHQTRAEGESLAARQLERYAGRLREALAAHDSGGQMVHVATIQPPDPEDELPWLSWVGYYLPPGTKLYAAAPQGGDA